jgi:hypothetical protein
MAAIGLKESLTPRRLENNMTLVPDAVRKEAYKSRWRMASRFIYHTHTDLRSIAEAWCRERCEQHEWDVKQFTNTYEDTFRFEFEEHFKEFSTWYERLDHN